MKGKSKKLEVKDPRRRASYIITRGLKGRYSGIAYLYTRARERVIESIR